MSIFDTIMALTRRNDPVEEMKKAIIAQNAAVPATPASPDTAPQPGPQQDPNAPPPPDQQPKAYQSPPDLSALYLELMNRDRNAREFDQGATLMAAAFARDENRDRIMKTYPDAQDTPDASMFNTLGLLQKQQQELLIKNQMRLALPRIAKEHNWSLEDTVLMFENGTLEEALKEADQPSYEVTTMPDGSTRVVDKRNVLRDAAAKAAAAAATPPAAPIAVPAPAPAASITPDTPARTAVPPTIVPPSPDDTIAAAAATAPGVELTPAKPKDVEFIDDGTGTNTKVAVWKGTNEKADGSGKVLKQPPTKKIEYMDGLHGRKIAKDATSGELVPDKDIPADQDIVFKDDANGQTQAFDSVTGTAIGKPMGPTKDQSTEDMKEWAKAYADAKSRGEQYPEWPEYLDNLNRSRDPKAVSGNVDPATGIDWGNPAPDMTYVRGPKGAFVMDKDTNTPKQVVVSGSKREGEVKVAEEAKKLATETALKTKADVTIAVERALSAVEAGEGTWTDPVTGLKGAVSGLVNPEGSRAILVGAIQTIKANMAFDKLHNMRMSNPTGGALGNVSNEELALLSSTVTNLDIGNPKVLKENLAYIRDIINDVPGAGKKYLAKIHADRVAAAKARGEPPPEAPPGLDNGGTTDDTAPAEANQPPAGAKKFRWDPKLKKKVPIE